MNTVSLVGRLTSTPELKYTNNKKAYTRFNLAINRNYTNQNGDREADFIECFAWEKRAELICKYVKKGNRLGVIGSLRSSVFEKEDGQKVYKTEVQISEIEFLESANSNKSSEETHEENNEEQEADPFAGFGETVSFDEDNKLD